LAKPLTGVGDLDSRGEELLYRLHVPSRIAAACFHELQHWIMFGFSNGMPGMLLMPVAGDCSVPT
jgi:hypothetical protein